MINSIIDDVKQIKIQDHLLFFMLKDSRFLDLFEIGSDLKLALLENETFKVFIEKEDSEFKNFINENPDAIVKFLCDSGCREKLIHFLLETSPNLNGQQTNFCYSKNELTKFASDVKRSMGVLSAEAAPVVNKIENKFLLTNLEELGKFVNEFSFDQNNPMNYEAEIEKLLADLKKSTQIQYRMGKEKIEQFKNILSSTLIDKAAEQSCVSHETDIDIVKLENKSLKNKIYKYHQGIVEATRKFFELYGELQKSSIEKVKLFTILNRLNELSRMYSEELSKIKQEKRNILTDFNNSSSSLKETELVLENKNSAEEKKLKIIQHDYEEAVQVLKNDNRTLQTKLLMLEDKVNKKDEEVSRFSDIIKSLQNNLKEVKSKFQTLNGENLTRAAELEKCSNDLESKCNENFRLKRDIEYLQSMLDRTESDKSALERSSERLTEVIQRSQNDIKENSKRLAECRKSCLKYEKLYHECRDENSSLRAQVKQIQSQCQIEEEEKQIIIKNLKKSCTEKSQMEKLIFDLRHEFETFDTKINESKKREDQLVTKVSFLEAVQKQLTFDLEKYQKLLQDEKNQHFASREQLKLDEQHNEQLLSKITRYEIDVSSLENQLKEEIQKSELIKIEKRKLEEKFKSLERKAGNTEELLSTEQLKFEQTLRSIRNDFLNDLSYNNKEKKAIAEKLNKLRHEVEKLQEELFLKNKQLQTNKNSLEQMQLEIKGRGELEFQLLQSESELKDYKSEMKSLKEQFEKSNKKVKYALEENNKLFSTIEHLKEQIHELKRDNEKKLLKIHSDYEGAIVLSKDEIKDLKEQLYKSEADLKTCQVSKRVLEESKEAISTTNYHFERTINSLKHRLHQEIQARILACQQIEALKRDISVKNSPNSSNPGADKEIIRLKKLIEKEKDKNKILKTKIHMLQSSAHTQEAHVQSLEIQLMEYYNESSGPKQQSTCLKSITSNSNDDGLEDLRTKLRLYDKEKSILLQSKNKFTIDLNECNGRIKDKLKENIKLEDKVLACLCKLKEMERECKLVKD